MSVVQQANISAKRLKQLAGLKRQFALQLTDSPDEWIWLRSELDEVVDLWRQNPGMSRTRSPENPFGRKPG